MFRTSALSVSVAIRFSCRMYSVGFGWLSQVHDVMGLSLRDEASLFQLECDRSRARFGVILMSFRFDPPVAADVVGDLDVSPCMGSSTVVRKPDFRPLA